MDEDLKVALDESMEASAKALNVDPWFYKLIIKSISQSIANDIIHGSLHIDHIFTWMDYKRKKTLKRIEIARY